MDNDDKIKDIAVRGARFFLRGSRASDVKQQEYQLDREFAKTKKNRSPVVIIAVLLFVAVFAVGAVLVTLYIQRESKRVAVNIEDFADVNLKDVLDRAKKFENQLAAAQRELQDLFAEMEREVQAVNDNLNRQLVLLENRQISSAEKSRQENSYRVQAENDIADIREKYQPKIEAIEARIAEIQGNIDAYDSKLIEQAKEQQEILDNQRRRFEIETEETVNYYETRLEEIQENADRKIRNLNEYHDSYIDQLNTNHRNEVAALKQKHANEISALILKYNPNFESERLKRILNRFTEKRTIDEVELEKYRDILQEEDILSPQDFRLLRSYLTDLSVLLSRLQEIPYENSIAPAIDQLEYMGTEIFSKYEILWSRMSDVLAERNIEVEQFLFGLDHLVSASRENGYILDARNPEKIIVYLDKILDVEDGDTGYVFRQEDELIALIRFNVTPEEITASLTESVSPDLTIAPFDKILIDIQ